MVASLLARGRSRLISPAFVPRGGRRGTKAPQSEPRAAEAATPTSRSSRRSSAAAQLGGGLAAIAAEPEASASGASAGHRQTRASIAGVGGAEQPPEELSADTREATRSARATQVCC